MKLLKKSSIPKAKIKIKDRKRIKDGTAILREQTQTSYDADFVVNEVSIANKKHKELPHVRINTVSTAQYSPEKNQKRYSIAKNLNI